MAKYTYTAANGPTYCQCCDRPADSCRQGSILKDIHDGKKYTR